MAWMFGLLHYTNLNISCHLNHQAEISYDNMILHTKWKHMNANYLIYQSSNYFSPHCVTLWYSFTCYGFMPCMLLQKRGWCSCYTCLMSKVKPCRIQRSIRSYACYLIRTFTFFHHASKSLCILLVILSNRKHMCSSRPVLLWPGRGGTLPDGV